MVMVSGIIESVQIGIWLDECIAPRRRGVQLLAMVDVWGFISLFSTEGHIVKWARGVPQCMSQSVLSRALWWNFCVCGIWNSAHVLSSPWNIHCRNYSNLQSSCLCSCVRKRRYGVWKVGCNCVYINQHHIMKINTQLHKNTQEIRSVTWKAVEVKRKKKILQPHRPPKLKNLLW